jgi:hypothetical protein
MFSIYITEDIVKNTKSLVWLHPNPCLLIHANTPATTGQLRVKTSCVLGLVDPTQNIIWLSWKQRTYARFFLKNEGYVLKGLVFI